MKIKVLIGFICGMLLAGNLLADEQSHRQLAEELMVTIKIDEQIQEMFDQMKEMQKQYMQRAGQSRNEEVPPEVLEMQEKVWNMMAEEMSWDKVKEDYIALYVGTFTEEDLRGLIEFYKSPAGQKFLEKGPELMRKSMEIGQRQTLKIMPEIQKLTETMRQEMLRKTMETPPATTTETKPSVKTNPEVK